MDRSDAETALTTNAGTPAADATKIVSALVQAVQQELFETIAGEAAAPSAIADIRARRLQLFYEHFTDRPLTRLEIQAIFRVQPNQAVAIDRKMRASFPKTGNKLLQRLVQGSAGDTVREGETDGGYSWVVTFAQAAGLDAAETLLERKALHGHVEITRSTRRLKIPLTDEARAHEILVDTLQLEEPTES